MSKPLMTANAFVMGFAVFLILVVLDVTQDIAIPILAGMGVGTWWWYTTDLAMKYEREEEDRLAMLDAQEAIEWADEVAEQGVTWGELVEEIEDEAAALGMTDELEAAYEQATQEMKTWKGGLVPVRQLEDERSNSELALRADRAYTIDQLLRNAGYTTQAEKSDFWSDNYERKRRGKRHSIQTIHNLDASVLTLTEWITDTSKETSIISIDDPIDEDQIKKTLGAFI